MTFPTDDFTRKDRLIPLLFFHRRLISAARLLNVPNSQSLVCIEMMISCFFTAIDSERISVTLCSNSILHFDLSCGVQHRALLLSPSLVSGIVYAYPSRCGRPISRSLIANFTILRGHFEIVDILETVGH
jgi:hypothetical protein